MSSSKHKIQHELSDMNVVPLCRAIKNIPCQGVRFKADEAFATFLQHAVASLVGANRKIGEPVFLIEAQFRKLGFTPVDPDAALPGQDKIMTAIEAYLNAVRDNEPFTDLLTPVHANFMGAGGEGLGQYFTPWDLAKLCSALAADHLKRHGSPTPLKISDPCCGAGGLLLATIQDEIADRVGWEEKAAALFSVHVHANDIDPLCAAMTALQLTANQIIHSLSLGEVRIEVGDTLTGKTECVFKTRNRLSLSRGSDSLGSSASLSELLIIDHFDKLGQVKDADAMEARILSNPPFGKGATAAWDRVWGEMRATFDQGEDQAA